MSDLDVAQIRDVYYCNKKDADTKGNLKGNYPYYCIIHKNVLEYSGPERPSTIAQIRQHFYISYCNGVIQWCAQFCISFFSLILSLRGYPGQPEVATDLPLIYYLIHTPLLRSAEECTTSYSNISRGTINCGQKCVTELQKSVNTVYTS